MTAGERRKLVAWADSAARTLGALLEAVAQDLEGSTCLAGHDSVRTFPLFPRPNSQRYDRKSRPETDRRWLPTDAVARALRELGVGYAHIAQRSKSRAGLIRALAQGEGLGNSLISARRRSAG